MDTTSLNNIQSKAFNLIQKDLTYLYTVFSNNSNIECNYFVSLQPYIGLIIDGAEDWISSVEKSNKCNLRTRKFTLTEQEYYQTMRQNIKFWEGDYACACGRIKEIYAQSYDYFSGLCKPIAKKLKLYDVFGVDIANGQFCGNTILGAMYTPYFSYVTHKLDSGYKKCMNVIGGEYIGHFNAANMLKTEQTMRFSMKDYGGLYPSPVGNKFSERFVLFSILCQLNFVLLCVNTYITEEIPTKLRFAYILYYYLLKILPEINSSLLTCFKMNGKWNSEKFRNAMMHYKLGIVLEKSEDIVETDMMLGLTIKVFGKQYNEVKDEIIGELTSLRNQIQTFLQLR